MFRLLSHQKNKNAFTPHLSRKGGVKLSVILFQKKGAGFTLIEVLAAIFVILVGVVGTLAIIQQTISYTALSSSRLTASYLAQEGMEIVRNIRDTNWLEGAADWKEGLPPSPPTYGVDYLTQVLPDPNCDNEGYLEFDGNFYTCSVNSNSKFQRKITITPDIDGPDSLKVSVLVKWQQIGKTHQVTAQEYLYNWR